MRARKRLTPVQQFRSVMWVSKTKEPNDISAELTRVVEYFP